MSWTVADHRFMARAHALAQRGLFTTPPNPRVGCVLVSDGQVVGEAWHERAGEAHAEVLAIRAAGDRARGSDCYVTLEPCSHHGRTPPCTGALIAAGVRRVLFACGDPDPRVDGRGVEQLRAAGVDVRGGLMPGATRELNPGFFKRMQDGLPFVRCKLAMSLDGRTAAADGGSRWISGPPAREDVQRLRGRSCVVLTGSGTVLADDPRLDVRMDGVHRQPLRVVLDRRLRTSPRARLLQPPGRGLVFTTSADAVRREALAAAGAEVVVLPGGPVSFAEAVLRHLATREQVNEVLVEAGHGLCGALLDAGLADELVVYVAAVLLGQGGLPLLTLPGRHAMADRLALRLTDSRRVGEDLRLTYQPA